MFSSAEEMQKALQDKKGLKFRGRDLRINRAVEPKRREKKMKRKAEALDERRKRKLEKKGDKDKESDEEIQPLKNAGDAYSSEDSEDEKTKLKKMNLPPVVRLEETEFGRKKSQLEKDESRELKMQNLIAF